VSAVAPVSKTKALKKRSRGHAKRELSFIIHFSFFLAVSCARGSL